MLNADKHLCFVPRLSNCFAIISFLSYLTSKLKTDLDCETFPCKVWTASSFAGAEGSFLGVLATLSSGVCFCIGQQLVVPSPHVLNETSATLITCWTRVILTLVLVSISSLFSSPPCSLWYRLLADSFMTLWQPFWQISQLIVCDVVFVLVCNGALRYCC